MAQTPGAAPGNAASAMSAPAAPAETNPNQAAQRFDIFEYVVDGNTVLDTPAIEEAVYPFLGEQKSAGDVDMAREALEKVYQMRGYQTVQVAIPEQGIETAVIHLQVIENPVGRLRVVGSKFHSLTGIRENASSLAEGTVSNSAAVQNDIAALNRQPDLKVTPRLKPGEAPGTVDVDLEVEDKLPVHGNIEINNQYNQKTEPLRVVGSVSYDNLWQEGHSISLSYQVAPQNISDAQVYSATYLWPVERTPLSILAYGVKSDSDVAALAGTDVVGRGTIFGLRGIINLPAAENFYHSFTVGIDRKNLTQNVITGGTPANSTVLYYPVSLAYAATWQQDDLITKAGGSIAFAVPAGSDSTKLDLQRFGALRQFVYAKIDVSRQQPMGNGYSVFGRIQGQISNDPLLSSEQLSAGGASSVRGYLEAERLGDYGAVGTIEFRTPSFGKVVSPSVTDLHFLTFLDGGALWLREPLPGEKSYFPLASAGIGARFSAFDSINGAADIAVAMVDGAVTKMSETRVHFRLWSGF
ncbi:MAG TPA: ShlB/FhaC/HecB family hemolysin secretion/activation protein [Micropepsaceae bacterium]|nr:ShlB/FhaC/HecB family hemolysin secretion/activation protein [Micropepsaceae bacterium]